MAELVCAVQASCGGCPLLTVDRQSELKTKLDLVSTSLSAVGVHAEVLAMPAQERFGYRNRLRMKVVDGRVEFFNKAKIAGCLVVRPDLWSGIEQLLRVSASSPRLLAGVTHIEVRVGDVASPVGRTTLGLLTSTPVDESPLQSQLGSHWVIGHRGMRHPPALRYRPHDDIELNVPITSFVQVNSDVNRQVVAAVMDVAARAPAVSFVDLFCGSGNFAIPLAKHGLTGVAVDNAGAAIHELANSVPAQAGQIRCVEADARSNLTELSPADLVIADPPRAGLQESHRGIIRLVDDTLALIGCKTSALAADVGALWDDGLSLESVRVFDMFPGTVHVETLAVLRRR